MRSQIERLWPRDADGKVIFQSHSGFDDFNFSNDERLAMLDRDREICEDTKRLWRENYGYDVIASYSHDPYMIKDIKLPFSPEVWVDLCNSEGEYLPMCCANISSIRDMLMGALREGGYMSCADLSECARLAEEHGWEHEVEEYDAVSEIIKLWTFVEPFAEVRVQSTGIDPNDPKDACRLVSRCSYGFIYDCLFDRNSVEGEAEFKRCRIDALRKIIPAIGVLYRRIEELNPGELNGWAVCRKDSSKVDGKS